MVSNNSVRDRTAIYLLIGCAAAAIGVPVLLAILNGGLTFPHNDAWSYSRIAQTFGQHWEFSLVGWNRGALFGQIVPLGPLAQSIVAQHIFVLILGLGSIPLVYDLVSRHSNRAMGLLAAATIVVFPGYALMSTSFMQDVPALFAGLACLVLGERAMDGRRWMLAASMAVGFWGMTIREQAIAAPVAVLLGIAWQHRGDRRVLAILGGWLIGLMAAFALFELWRSGLPYGDPPEFEWLPLRDAGSRVFRGYITLGLVVSPLLLATAPRMLRNRRTVYGVLCVAMVEVIFMLLVPSAGRLIGGYLNPAGSYPAAYNGLREIIPRPLELALIGVGIVGGAVLPFVVAAGWRRLAPVLFSYAVLLGGGTFFVIFTGQPVFDRYFLPFVPLVAILCGPFSGRSASIRGAIGLTTLGLITLLMNLNALSVDAALWRTAQSVAASGVPNSAIDAGFDWYGYHSTAPADQRRMRSDPSAPFYLTLFPDSRSCVAVTVSPPSGGEVLRTETYRRFGFFGSDTLWVVDTGKCVLDSRTIAAVRSSST